MWSLNIRNLSQYVNLRGTGTKKEYRWSSMQVALYNVSGQPNSLICGVFPFVTRVVENWLAPTGGHGCPFPNPPPLLARRDGAMTTGIHSTQAPPPTPNGGGIYVRSIPVASHSTGEGGMQRPTCSTWAPVKNRESGSLQAMAGGMVQGFRDASAGTVQQPVCHLVGCSQLFRGAPSHQTAPV